MKRIRYQSFDLEESSMKKQIIGALASFFLVIILISGCNLGLDGTSSVSLSVTGASSTDASRDFIDAHNGTIAFTTAFIALERIELKLLGDESITDTELETMYNGPYSVDLLADLSTQEIGTVEIPSGIYGKIEMELTDALEGSYSVIITGTYTPESGTATDFVYRYMNTEDFKIEDPAGFEVSGSDVSLLLSFDLDQWFASVDFSTAPVVEGTIVLDADTIEAYIEAAGEIGIDDNRDGIID